jgi:hypothetical protein
VSTKYERIASGLAASPIGILPSTANLVPIDSNIGFNKTASCIETCSSVHGCRRTAQPDFAFFLFHLAALVLKYCFEVLYYHLYVVLRFIQGSNY